MWRWERVGCVEVREGRVCDTCGGWIWEEGAGHDGVVRAYNGLVLCVCVCVIFVSLVPI